MLVNLSASQINQGMRQSGSSLGAGQFTFSIPVGVSTWPASYAGGSEPYSSYSIFSPSQAADFRLALGLWDAVIAPDFTEVIETASTYGELRVAFTDTGGSAGYAYSGSPQPAGGKVGDIWISSDSAGESFARGTQNFETLVHEIGHTLGLKHPFEAPVLDPAYDNSRYTVMSYTVPGNYISFSGPQNSISASAAPVAVNGPMVVDIAAVQAIYAAETTTATGNDVYTFTENTPIINTIYDAGGSDTIDVSSFTRTSIIDLRPGAYSSIGYFSEADQRAFWKGQYANFQGFIDNWFTQNGSGGNTVYQFDNNLGIAFTTMIENAFGGAGNDEILGNDAANELRGNGGGDTLTGGKGDDTLRGGNGTDIAVFSGTKANYVAVVESSGYRVTDQRADADGSDFLEGIETFRFSDGDIAASAFGTPVVNQPPAANDDTVNTPEDTPLTFDPKGNDSDPDANSIVITAVGLAAHGSVVLNGNNTLTYTPAANYNGPDSFSYTLSDGKGGTDTATVSITVSAVNDAPVAASEIANQSSPEDTAWSFQVPGNAFSDVETPSLTYTAALGSGAALPAWLSFNAGTRTFTGTPPANFNGAIDLKVTASDGSLTASDTFTLTVTPVNDAPVVASPTQSLATKEDTALTGNIGATDPDGNVLTYAVSAAATKGTAAVDAGGKFTYTPTLNFNGADSFAVTAKDAGGLSVTQTVNVTVTAVNDAPTFAAAKQDLTIAEDTVLSGQAAASDVDQGDTITYSATTPANGAVAIGADGKFTYTPAANFNGKNSFTITAKDAGGLTASQTIAVTVTAVNDAPVASPDTTKALTIAEDNSGTVIINFSDPEGNTPLTQPTFLDSPDHGVIGQVSGKWVYTPVANFHGEDKFTYSIKDSLGAETKQTVNITVTPVNDAPVLSQPIADQSASANAPWSFQIPTGAITDVDGDPLTFLATLDSGGALPAWLSFNPATRTFTGTPPVNFTTLALKVSASDGVFSVSDTFSVNAVTGNLAPVVTNAIPDQTVAEDNAWNFQIAGNTFFDSNGDALTYSATLASGAALPAWLSFNGAAYTFTGTPPVNFNGNVELKVTASDGQLSASDSFVLTVTPVNDAPVPGPENTATLIIAEDTSGEVVIDFNDPENDPLGFTVTDQPLHGSFGLVNDVNTYQPNANYFGSDSLRYVVFDGKGGFTVKTVDILVTPVNDAPVLSAGIADQLSAKDAPWAFQVPAGTFTDVDNASLTYTAALAGGGALPAWLSFNGGTRTFTGQPPAGFVGSLELRVTASDGALAANDVFRISIGNNPPVVADSQTIVTLVGTPVQFTLGATDADGDTLNYVVSPVAVGTVGLTGDIFTYTPPADFTGNTSFAVTVADGKGGSDTQAVTVSTIAPPAAADWRLFAGDGFVGQIGGAGAVLGTAGAQDITLLNVAGRIDLDPSFNRGGDIIRLAGDADDWSVVRSGSSALLSDGDSFVQIPVGSVGAALVFEDGTRTLKVDGSAIKIGDQVLTTTFTEITAAAQAAATPIAGNPDAAARLFLASGGDAVIGGHIDPFGTNSAETLTVLSGKIALDPSFNRGGDSIIFNLPAEDFLASRDGSNVLLVSAATQISIPVGSAGTTLVFAGDDERVLISAGGVLLGDQPIGFTPVALSEFA